METEIKTTEKPLFTIKTIKKKHAEQVRETHIDTRTEFGEYDVLGKIDAWSAVLIKHQTTGHYRVVPVHRYADWLTRTKDMNSSEAYQLTTVLEQLFLD